MTSAFSSFYRGHRESRQDCVSRRLIARIQTCVKTVDSSEGVRTGVRPVRSQLGRWISSRLSTTGSRFGSVQLVTLTERLGSILQVIEAQRASEENTRFLVSSLARRACVGDQTGFKTQPSSTAPLWDEASMLKPFRINRLTASRRRRCFETRCRLRLAVKRFPRMNLRMLSRLKVAP